MRRVRGWVRAAGWPLRFLMVGSIKLYRLTVGRLAGDRCRFYPSCSAYAEEAIRRFGVVRGIGLAVWRILRCNPLFAGGIDYPPGHGGPAYDDVSRQGRRRTDGAAA